MTLAALASRIERAFKAPRLAAVALTINSPGGSPVQSALIAKRIRDLAEEKQVPVIAFAEDVAASGGYWLACAADEIYADESSILGSIGVISAGFGFPELLARHGVERRVHSSGARKGMLDPFQAESPDDLERLKAIQSDIHDSFKDLVRSRRAGKLKGDENDLFNGDIFSGRQALALGLIDGIGDMRTVLRERFGDKVRLRVIDGPRRLRLPFGIAAGGLGGLDLAASAHALVEAAEERALWSRYGL